ncbi:MAG: type II secretion system minor pseudopilin GspK [Sterolibacterium sp.]|nr:type II secretion system minor pseudopilin GspK [Sterolibacterium sp.]
MNSPHSRPQHGAALIMALLVVALVTPLATTLIWQQHNWLRGMETRRDLNQARQLASAGVDWARAVLAEDARKSRHDHPGEPWATRVPNMPVEDGEIGGAITDEQSKYNLNNLVRNGRRDDLEIATFRRLLAGLQLPQQLAGSLADWLDADDQPGEDGAEDDDYLALQPPYRAANRELSDLDNLLRIKGYTPRIVAQLRPYVTVLPGYNPLNLNTAGARVLGAVLHDFSTTEIRQIIAERERIPFLDENDLRSRLAGQIDSAQRPSLVGERIGTRSTHFSVLVHTRHGQASVRLQALLQRNTFWPRILWQKFD